MNDLIEEMILEIEFSQVQSIQKLYPKKLFANSDLDQIAYKCNKVFNKKLKS